MDVVILEGIWEDKIGFCKFSLTSKRVLTHLICDVLVVLDLVVVGAHLLFEPSGPLLDESPGDDGTVQQGRARNLVQQELGELEQESIGQILRLWLD